MHGLFIKSSTENKNQSPGIIIMENRAVVGDVWNVSSPRVDLGSTDSLEIKRQLISPDLTSKELQVACGLLLYQESGC